MRKMKMGELAQQPEGVVFVYSEYDNQFIGIKGKTNPRPEGQSYDTFQYTMINEGARGFANTVLYFDDTTRDFLDEDTWGGYSDHYVAVLESEEIIALIARLSKACGPT